MENANAGRDKEAAGIIERLTQAMQIAGLNQAEVARRAQSIHPKANKAVLNKSSKHGTRPRDHDAREAFAQVLGVRSSYLWYGQPSRGSLDHDAIRKHHEELEEETAREADGQTDAGPKASNAPRSGQQVTLPLRPDPQGYIIVVSHSSWEPIICRGDTLYVCPSYSPNPGDRVYVRLGDGEGVYRVVAADSRTVTVLSPAGLQTTLPRADAEIHRIGAILCA